MKTKMLLIAVAIMLSSFGIASAQKEKNVYAFCYGYLYENKTIYISPVVSGVENREGYLDPSTQALDNQWQNALKKEVDDFYAYFKSHWGWTGDYDAVDNARTDMIRDFKSKNFTIIYIDDFYFRQKERQ